MQNCVVTFVHMIHSCSIHFCAGYLVQTSVSYPETGYAIMTVVHSNGSWIEDRGDSAACIRRPRSTDILGDNKLRNELVETVDIQA